MFFVILLTLATVQAKDGEALIQQHGQPAYADLKYQPNTKIPKLNRIQPRRPLHQHGWLQAHPDHRGPLGAPMPGRIIEIPIHFEKLNNRQHDPAPRNDGDRRFPPKPEINYRAPPVVINIRRNDLPRQPHDDRRAHPAVNDRQQHPRLNKEERLTTPAVDTLANGAPRRAQNPPTKVIRDFKVKQEPKRQKPGKQSDDAEARMPSKGPAGSVQPGKSPEVRKFRPHAEIPQVPKPSKPKLTTMPGITVEYVSAPYVVATFPLSGRKAKVILDTGSNITWVPKEEMCSRAVCAQEDFACKYGKGACKGKMYNTVLQIDQTKVQLKVGAAHWREDSDKGIVGLDMMDMTDPKRRDRSILANWNLPSPDFGFIPQNHIHVVSDNATNGSPSLKLREYAQFYLGQPLDVTNCLDSPIIFPINSSKFNGRWVSENVQIFVDRDLIDTVSVLWDTGTTQSKTNDVNIHARFPTELHLVELGNSKARLGMNFSGRYRMFGPKILTCNFFIVGMNFFSNFVVHFNYGPQPFVALCTPNRNAGYAR
jgi:hypothetical protein